VNGESREVATGLTLAELVADLNLAVERVAVELNHTVVRRGDWATTTLEEGDRIEIVHFVGGGVTCETVKTVTRTQCMRRSPS
jgi:thiamine biosynthesis protein ThiS